MTERYTTALSDPVETAQPVAETTGRMSKIGRLKQRLGRSTALQQLASSRLSVTEDNNSGITADLHPGTDPEPSKVSDYETETREEAAEEKLHREDLVRPTPKEQALLSGNIVREEFRGGGQHYVELDNGEAGLYWPDMNTTGGKYRNERATYLVDRAWQFGLVPTTVMREVTYKYGKKDTVSFQEYIPDAIDSREIKDFEAAEQFYNDFYKLWILNYSIWNTDPHKGNVIATDRLYAIDHEHAFWENSNRWRHSFMDIYILGASAPKDVIAAAEIFLSDKVRQEVLEEQLKEALQCPDHIIQACLARMIHVAEILTTKGRIETLEELSEYSPN
ncbi:hypothetical protein HYW35_03605 [Candidatus Saccharibacteria bacterium]|nr:hypothetical protein [Candidatus Saccharibacteria bacterium]